MVKLELFGVHAPKQSVKLSVVGIAALAFGHQFLHALVLAAQKVDIGQVVIRGYVAWIEAQNFFVLNNSLSVVELTDVHRGQVMTRRYVKRVEFQHAHIGFYRFRIVELARIGIGQVIVHLDVLRRQMPSLFIGIDRLGMTPLGCKSDAAVKVEFSIDNGTRHHSRRCEISLGRYGLLFSATGQQPTQQRPDPHGVPPSVSTSVRSTATSTTSSTRPDGQ